MELPKTPYFAWNPEDGYFDLTADEEAPTKTRANRLGMVKQPDRTTIVFDSEGGVRSYRFEGPRPKPSCFNKVLAQVYNPIFDVGMTRTRLRDYHLEVLIQAFCRAVERNEDILTQVCCR